MPLDAPLRPNLFLKPNQAKEHAGTLNLPRFARSVDHAAIGGVHTKRLRAARSRNSLQGISFCSRVTASAASGRVRQEVGANDLRRLVEREDRPVGISAQLQGRSPSF